MFKEINSFPCANTYRNYLKQDPPRDAFWDDRFGWIKRNEFLYKPTESLQDGYEGEKNLKRILINHFNTLNYQDSVKEYITSDIQEVIKCPHAGIFLVRYGKDLMQDIDDEGKHPPLHEGKAEKGPTDEGLEFGVNNILPEEHSVNVNRPPNPMPTIEEDKIYVGIIDRGHMSQDPKETPCHIDRVADLVKEADPDRIVAIDVPIVGSCDESSTIFDLICALYSPRLEPVSLINLSQGFYSMIPSVALQVAMGRHEVPILCSAGNAMADNDCCWHWPSNFSFDIEHVLAVAATKDDGNFEISYSNFGNRTVTLSALGNHTDRSKVSIGGTSYATAFCSGLMARAMLSAGKNATMKVLLQEMVTFNDIIVDQNPSHRSNSKYYIIKKSKYSGTSNG